MNPTFEFSTLTKTFGKQTVLDQVSLAGQPGQVIALLGENGAGKTTALKILMGLIAPDGGASQVYGLDSQKFGPEIRQRVGYMPDRPALYDWMTVEEIGWFAAGFYPLGFQDRFTALMQRFKIPLTQTIKALSKGMQGKVSLSLALAHEPQLLVLDEPTSGLDPLVRREFLESMIDVAARGRTVLLSSHQIAEVERVADVVAILRGGKLVLCDSLETLKSEVSQVEITLKDIETAPPVVSGAAVLLSANRHDRTWQLLVRGLDDAGRMAWEADDNHASVEIRRPSLEEIFVACMTAKPLGETVSSPLMAPPITPI